MQKKSAEPKENPPCRFPLAVGIVGWPRISEESYSMAGREEKLRLVTAGAVESGDDGRGKGGKVNGVNVSDTPLYLFVLVIYRPRTK